jgi:hypothetical protein
MSPLEEALRHATDYDYDRRREGQQALQMMRARRLAAEVFEKP